MPTMSIHLPADLYGQLEAQVRQAGTTPEALTRELLQTALHAYKKPQPHTAREVLHAAGRVRPLSDALQRQIIPGVTLEEVRQALSQAGEPALSEMIQAQRGPKV